MQANQNNFFKIAAVVFAAAILVWLWPRPHTAKPLPKADQEGITVVAVGDIACAPGLALPGECHQDRTAKIVSGINPAAVLVLGDTQYQSGELANYRASYDKTWGKFLDITYPAIGNHEYATPGAVGFHAYFKSRLPGQKSYYSFNLGDWHLIALDSNCGIVSCLAGSDQEKWLRQDLASSQAACTLAFWHHPAWSSGDQHGSEPALKPLWNALVEAKAELALSGHEHNYERFVPMDARGNAIGDGLRQFVVGTGGRSIHYTFRGEPLSTSQFRDSDNYGVMKLVLKQSSYTWQFINEHNQVIDSGTSQCH